MRCLDLTDNFNGDISGWDVAGYYMRMFSERTLYQDISAWDVSSVYMAAMFRATLSRFI